MVTIDELLSAGAPPIVAILRGIQPSEAIAIAQVLIDAGLRIMEIPLNSPEPFSSISAMQEQFGEIALIGAGTVLDPTAVETLARTGARLMVTPNTDLTVIAKGAECRLELMPGFSTPTEAFAAVSAGARRLKLFPASVHGLGYVKAIREVLPDGVGIWAVGGVDATNALDWLNAGAEGVAAGSALYRPGDTPEMVRRKAADLLASLQPE